jgi:hypothetical protein
MFGAFNNEFTEEEVEERLCVGFIELHDSYVMMDGSIMIGVWGYLYLSIKYGLLHHC